MLRFVHAADLHLDSPLRSGDGPLLVAERAGLGGSVDRRTVLADAVRASLRAAFEALIDLCLREQVDALLLAGDLLDVADPTAATHRWLCRQIGRLAEAGIAVVAVSGNHDPGDAAPWPVPGMLRVVGGQPRQIELRRPGTQAVVGAVMAAGHECKDLRENLAARFPRWTRPEPCVAMLHGQLEGAGEGQHGPYAPFHLGDLRGKGYCYWALGHVHRRRRLALDEECWYPGNLAGRSLREDGAKGALLVEVPGGGTAVRTSFHELAPLRFERLRLPDPSLVHDFASLSEAVGQCFAARRAEAAAKQWVLAVELGGVSPLALDLPRSWLERRARATAWGRELAAEWGALDLRLDFDGLRSPTSWDALAREATVFGEAARLLRDLEPGSAQASVILDEASLLSLPADAGPRAEALQALLAAVRDELSLRCGEGR